MILYMVAGLLVGLVVLEALRRTVLQGHSEAVGYIVGSLCGGVGANAGLIVYVVTH